MTDERELMDKVERIAAALERWAPPRRDTDPDEAPGFLWDAGSESLLPVRRVRHLPLKLLLGVETQKERLLANTRQLVRGLPANNALLWGARGTGKSALVKAVFGHLAREHPRLRIVEIERGAIHSLPMLMRQLRAWEAHRFIVFCDDLSFEEEDETYKTLKAALEGGIEGRPENTVFYATSNRRHLMPRDMIENERSTAIHPSEATQEKVSLSDRFGLWMGFHPCDQDTYLAIVRAYAEHCGLETAPVELRAQALEWAVARGGRSGRVAWQFIIDLAGRLGRRIEI